MTTAETTTNHHSTGQTMLKYISVILTLLFVPAYLAAADVPISGADKPADHYAVLTVKYEPGDLVSWKVYPTPLKKTTFDKEPGTLVCVGKPGVEYTVFVTIVNFGDKEGQKKRYDEGQVPLVFAGTAPPPTPPGPTPPGPGPTPPSPAPQPDGTSPFTDFRMLLIIPGKDGRLTQNQFDIIYGEDVGKFLETTLGDNYRIYTTNTNVDNAPKVWKDAFMRKRPPPELPWVVIGNGKSGYEGPLRVKNPDGTVRDITPEEFKNFVLRYKP